MGSGSLGEALEREHREIDEGIERFTAAPPPDRDGRSLTRAIQALRRHVYLEEEFLFPALYNAELAGQILVTLREHAQIWTTLDALERKLETGAADGTEDMLCRKLTVRLLHHNLKEEKKLYPQADAVLTASATARLHAFLDSGRLPEGWVCRRARS